MEEELSLDNILGQDQINSLFTDSTDDQEVEEKKENTDKKEDIKTAEVDVNDLFAEPESVGSEEKQEKKDTIPPEKESSASPKNIYSSIAKAFKEDSIFPDLGDSDIENIKNAEDFADIIEKQIQAKFDERQRRIDKALNLGIEDAEIKKYEDSINYLDSISDEAISSENDQGEDLRKRLILQDFVNKGYSKERASREVKKSFDAGTDIEDAKDALNEIKKYYNSKYQELVDEAEQFQKQEKDRVAKEGEDLKKSILEDKEFFGNLELDKNTRNRVYENITKPVYKDPETGLYYTAIQKYQKENSKEFIKNLGILFTLTDGFKNIDGLVNKKVKKEVRKNIRELENTLNNSSTDSDGNLRFISGVSQDPESFIGRGWSLSS